ncbi:uncharacterized protein LOC123528762 [Mercenaria mercenaria]|uniref:uncharacterized protein LOC123528762 n=1 Tax=Mercenaria mercenaria TaxID=6596 RepID=UPI00234EE31D|nr:uncharacterized protein LOC123528762 [Mercenaria mercenaria]
MIETFILALALTCGSVRAQRGCDSKADVTFLIDSSGNIGQRNFEKQIGFVKDTMNRMEVAPDKVQVSAVTFGNTVSSKFYLNQFSNNTFVQNALLNIPYSGGQVKMVDAIRYATTTAFSPSHGGRGDVPHVVVLLTNQPSGSIDMIKLASQTARDNGLILYTVGIGNGVDTNELKAITSDPDSRHLFTAQNFDALTSLSDLLATKICNELPPNPHLLPVPTGCLQRADLVFMVDSSSSVGNANFQKLEHFLKDVVSKIDVAPNKVQVGVVKYGSYPSVEFSLGQHVTRPTVMKAVEGMTYLGGGTNDADAIRYTGQQVFNQNSGARGDVPRIAVLITDGGSADPAAAIAAAQKTRTENIGTIVVGVGNNINKAELSRIADSPSTENMLTVRSYDNLDSITNKLIEQMCKVKATQTSLTTSSPGDKLPVDPCHDKTNNCDQYGSDVCTNYGQWARVNCARTCGFCTPLYTIAPPKCSDSSSSCASQSLTDCSKTGSFVQLNCQKFCGLCTANTSSTGYYGKCSYKDKTYNTGEKWLDGCDYECICEDGNTGRYKCNNRCPVYRNLPEDCTLTSQSGSCCLQPVCNFNPTINVQQSSGHAVTSSGIDVCVYRAKQFFQRQSWRDGCDYQCTCTNATAGLYQCDDLCPVYSSIPPYCHLEQPVGECCKKPVCEFNTQSGSFTGYGSISGYGIAKTPSQQPVCSDVDAKCSEYGKDVCVSYRGWAVNNCRKFCNMCDEGPVASGPNDHCVYGGIVYSQGDSWNTSCDTVCTCENAAYGYYRCNNICPSYNNLPRGCHVVKKSGECCPVVQCQDGYFFSSSTNLGSLANGLALSVSNPPAGKTPVQPTLPSGEVLPLGAGSAGFTAPTINGCLYKGQLYIQDQAWEDGCEFSCICKDASTGLYSCKHKCPSYPALPASCQLVRDVNDECCQSPQCGPDPVTHKVPVPLPVFRPAAQTHNAVKPPSVTDTDYGHYTMTVYLAQTGMTPPRPTAPQLVPTGGIGFCTYNGKQYQQGELWEDGCNFNCICEDASKGHYNCLEKCVHYDALPEHCYLKTDPANPCCDIPVCNIPVNFGGHFGEVTTTLKPKGDYCVYEGQKYLQGQTWYDGCSYRCTCEDAANNIYRCLSRCLEYENVAESCRFVPDPRDPGCCMMPECPVTGSPNPYPTPAIPGKYNGHSMTTGFCEYKGSHYSQGQKWNDGCELNCECTDAQSGFYRCTETCPRYPQLPAYCDLVTDFTKPCCKTVRCKIPSSTAAITGSMTSSTMRVPTPMPSGQTPVTPSTINGSYPVPHYKYCVYKQVQYNQGQTWNDGCDYTCRCDDAVKGLYTCSQRCASYGTVADGCQLVTDPEDSCCLVPYCTPQPRSTSLPISGSPVPTPYRIPTPKPGTITGTANRPTLKPDIILPPLNYCEYKGHQYKLHEKWDDGCEWTCECVDDKIGKYACTEKCPPHVNLPSNCRLVRDAANPCCKIPTCSPTPSPPTTKGPGLLPMATVPTQRPQKVCIYKGKTYTQGQQWYDGCDYICTCEDSVKGVYTCNDRCPSFPPLPAECTLVPSPSDALCCKEPKCIFPHTTNDTTGFFTPPTLPTGVVTGGRASPPTRLTVSPLPLSVQPSGMTISPTPAGSTVSPPYVVGVSTPSGSTFFPPSPSTVSPTPEPMCVYKNHFYQQGQTWQDGCEYKCECLNAATGRYKCTPVCPVYPPVPSNCNMITDPYQPCCKKPYCRNTPPPIQTMTPYPEWYSTHSPTPPVTPAYCVYNGAPFSQGQQWNDGCDLQCICQDATNNIYKCRDRCNTYDVPPGCTLMTDPRDACCKVPDCNIPVPATPGPMPPYQWPTPPSPGTGPTPAYTGAFTLSPTPSGPPTPVSVTGKFDVYSVAGNRSGCVDQGATYKVGDTWQQGCRYNCKCLDSAGRYQCTDRCPVYMNLPTTCRLEIDPKDTCCKVAICQTQPPTPLAYSSSQSPSTPRNYGSTPNKYGSTPSNYGSTPNNHGSTPNNYGSTPSNYGSTPNKYGSTPNNYGTTPVSHVPSPSSQSTISPPTPLPTVRGCIMDGRHYVSGQTWYKDCSQQCVCEDGSTGLYRCNDRCAKYDTIPSNCTLVPDPSNPACCKVPQCIPLPVPGTATPTGPPVTVTGVTGKITGTLPPGVNGNRSTCVYQGRMYTQGQKWQDGCQYNCICTDGKTGKYECTQRCAAFPIVPPQCTMQRNLSDICCLSPVCDFSKTPTPFPPLVSQAPNTSSPVVQPPLPTTFCVYMGVAYKQGQTWDIGCQKKCRCDDSDNNIYTCFDRCKTYKSLGPDCIMIADPNDACCQIPKCFKVPTPAPSTGHYQSPTPNGYSSPTPSGYSGPTPNGYSSPTPSGYSGPTPNGYSSPTPSGYSGPTPNGYSSPTPGYSSPTPGYSGPTPTVCSNPVPTAVPGVIMGSPLLDPRTGALSANIGYCEYKGSQYKQDATWEDGCSYVCTCIDANSGQYQCQEKCPRYVDPPPYCKMVQDPANKCCMKPSCNACPQTPTPQTYTPVSGLYPPTPTPPPCLCVMNGKQYSEGQKWYVGCDKMCVCDDGSAGIYSCYDRCPSYPMQAGCTMVPDLRDPVCCQVPSCPGGTVVPIYGNTTGFGTAPPPTDFSVVPSSSIPPSPGMVPNSSIPPSPGLVSGSSIPPSPGMVSGSTVSPSPKMTSTLKPGFSVTTSASIKPAVEVCVYKGNMYGQGQRWQDGCQYDCTCDDAKTGHFHCTDRCPRYPNLPATCQLIHDPSNPCCQKPVCPPTPLPATVGPDGKTPTISPFPTPPTEFCVYQGVPLRQGQTFNQGCDKICKCEDAKMGKITCTDRCPTYPALTPNCTLVTDPRDECCQVPYCIDKGNNSTSITGVPGAVYGYSLPVKNQYTGVRNGCVYNGKVYSQGQKWDDGCTYTCECLDMSTGQYRCTQICPRYPPLPSYCALTQDPSNKCCQKPYCQQQPTPTVNPSVSSNTTLSPPQNVCVYKGSTYQEGQLWYDGCNSVCRCDDSSKNIYTCNQRCAMYATIPQGCVMVPDPKDPSCCQVPSCPIPPKPTIGIVTAPQPTGTITGVRPTSSVGTGTASNKAGCMYKGTLVYQGQRFDDGCDYSCECLDNATGKYRCDKKCSEYTSLPKECILVQDPKQPCCQVPYCDFINPTPFPTGYPTPPPQVSPTPQTNVIVVAPYKEPPIQSYSKQGYCVYKSVYYSQGQTWFDGCDLKCTCENVTTGYYSCSQRCPLFPPSSCPRRADPSDSCCLIPDCNTGKIPATVYPPGYGQSTVNPVIKPTPVTGGYIIGRGLVPYQTGSGFTGSTPACIYNGQVYKQGDTWTDRCKYNCECIDATHGQYKCTERCPRYPNLPAQCYYKQSSKDVCCQEAECRVYGSTTVTPSTVSPTAKFTVKPTPTVSSTTKPAPSLCVYYNGKTYTQGTVWQDSCAECRCENATANSYTCNQRCPIFVGLPSFCTLISDPNDKCCKKPSCSPTNGLTLTPLTGNATYPPTSLSVLPVGTHQVFSGNGRPIGGSGSIIGGRNVCAYKGIVYAQGQSWEDGCDFVCSCENGVTGMYRCAAKCPHYPNLPSYCKLVAIPGRCCSNIVCDIPGYGIYKPGIQLTNSSWSNYSAGMGGNNTVISIPGTIGFVGGSRYPGGGYYLPNATKPNVLVDLRGHLFVSSLICRQINEIIIRAIICPVYSRLPSNICYLQKFDGQCCSEPRCLDREFGVYVNPFNSSKEFPVVGTFSGGFSGFRPLAFPGHKEVIGSHKSGCYYKGSLYNEGDKWEDNCDFSCTCVNQTSGLYSCLPKCPTYTNLPQMCRLEANTGSCCKEVVCDHQLPIGPTHAAVTNTKPPTQCPGLNPYCYDRINNCRDYGTQACGSPYVAWARRNCPFTCGFCDCSEHGSSLQVCEDKLNNCKDFGKGSCTGIYESWARDNCKQFCGYCPTTPSVSNTTPIQTTPGAPVCEDNLSTCSLLDPGYYCVGEFLQYGYDNCRKTCNLCSTTTIATTTIATPTSVVSTAGILVSRETTTRQTTTTLRPEEACNFNGHLYSKGQTWNSGTKICTCEDPSVGYYKCTDRCPDYQTSGIPPVCHIVKVQGQCPTVQCPAGVTFKPQNITVTVPGLCEYKGQYYSQDMTWDDGCRQTCTCTDASSGLATCRSLCLNFNSLPSICHLDDPPQGKCCMQPKCPENVFIPIPIAYKDQYPGYQYV